MTYKYSHIGKNKNAYINPFFFIKIVFYSFYYLKEDKYLVQTDETE